MDAQGTPPAPGRSTVWDDRLAELRRHRPSTDAQVAERLRARRRSIVRPALWQAAQSAATAIGTVSILRLAAPASRAEAIGIAAVSLVFALISVLRLVAIGRLVVGTLWSEEDRRATPQEIADLTEFATRVPAIAAVMADWMAHAPLRRREVHMLRLAWNLWRADRACPGMLSGVQFDRLDRAGAGAQ